MTADIAVIQLPIGIEADFIGVVDLVKMKALTWPKATDEKDLGATYDVVDIPDHMAEQVAEVRRVLEEIGAGAVPLLEVCNKIDRLENVEPHIDRDAEGHPVKVWISAQEGIGLDLLQEALEELVPADPDLIEEHANLFQFPPSGQHLGIVTVFFFQRCQDPSCILEELLIDEEVDLLEVAHRGPLEAVRDLHQLVRHLLPGRRYGRNGWRRLHRGLLRG